MLFGIRSQLTILVIMLVSSTGLTLVFACVYTHTYTYAHTGMADNKSEMIICYNEKGVACHIQYDSVNKHMLVSSLRIKRPSFGQCQNENSKDRGS